MSNKAPVLPLTQEEKTKLRKAKVTLKNIKNIEAGRLAEVLETSFDRARVMKALAAFQSVPSIGYKLSEKMVHQLNRYSWEDVKDEDGARLFDQLEQELGVWTDPCVEDQLRCIVHYANNPDSDLSWYDFTVKRKDYRAIHGYPESRPKKAWYD